MVAKTKPAVVAVKADDFQKADAWVQAYAVLPSGKRIKLGAKDHPLYLDKEADAQMIKVIESGNVNICLEVHHVSSERADAVDELEALLAS